MLRRNIYEHNAKIYRARKAGRSSPQRRSHLVVLTLRNLSPNRSQKRPIYHLNCESQASVFVSPLMPWPPSCSSAGECLPPHWHLLPFTATIHNGHEGPPLVHGGCN